MRDNDYERGGAPRASAWDEPDRSMRYSGNRMPKKSSKAARLRRVIVIILLVFCLVGNSVYTVLHKIIKQVTVTPSASQTATVTPSAEALEEMNENMGEDEFDISNIVVSDKDVEIMLIIGSDNDFRVEACRSDSIMLVAIDRIHEELKVISIMRDIYAPITGYKGSNKINFAFYCDSAWGNQDLSVTRNTIRDCFGVSVDHYVVVSFYIFASFCEWIGGMDVELTKGEAQYMLENNRWYSAENLGKSEAGQYHLNGNECLHYCRMRHEGEGDFDRTRRQREFLAALIEKAKHMSYKQMVGIVTSVLPGIATDMTENQILGYCFDAPKLLNYPMVQLRFPIEGSYYMSWATIGTTNVSILLTNFEFSAQALQDFIYEDDMTYVNGAVASNVVKPTVTTKSFTTTTELEETEPTEIETQPTEAPTEAPTEPVVEVPTESSVEIPAE